VTASNYTPRCVVPECSTLVAVESSACAAHQERAVGMTLKRALQILLEAAEDSLDEYGNCECCAIEHRARVRAAQEVAKAWLAKDK